MEEPEAEPIPHWGFDQFYLKMTLEEVFVMIEEKYPQYWNLRKY